MRREQGNDLRGEDGLLAFHDTAHKSINWQRTLKNLKDFGEKHGYSETIICTVSEDLQTFLRQHWPLQPSI